MAKVNVRLLKPLNGAEIGSEAQYDQRDAKRLVALGAVALIKTKAPAKAKAEKPALNKMETVAQNKAAGGTSDPASS